MGYLLVEAVEHSLEARPQSIEPIEPARAGRRVEEVQADHRRASIRRTICSSPATISSIAWAFAATNSAHG